MILRWGFKSVDDGKNWDPYVLVKKEKMFSSLKHNISGKDFFIAAHERALYENWKAERSSNTSSNGDFSKPSQDETLKEESNLYSSCDSFRSN